MPRQARLDAPGTLHHVIIRGIEKRKIVDDKYDRKNFVTRLGDLASDTKTNVINLTDGFVSREEFSYSYFMVSRIFSTRPNGFNGSLKNILQLSNQLGDLRNGHV